MKRAMLCLGLTCAFASGCPSDEEPTLACLPADVFEAIEQHALDLASTAALVAGHASEGEVTGFFLAPALPNTLALPASFATLVMPCAEPISYDPFCEAGRCSQITCTGQGAGWVHHLWLDKRVEADNWSFEAVDVYLGWSDDEPETPFRIETTATSPSGRDASMSALGTMDSDGQMELDAVFPALHPAGSMVLDYRHRTTDDRGQLSIDDVVVAEVGPRSGRLLPTGDCP